MKKKITILHTNDTHSHIDPFPADHPKNPNMGGAARRAAIIDSIRKEEKNVLLLDAGDIFSRYSILIIMEANWNSKL